ncbi:hypothetical protein [Bradyrhizobium sp. th.b2]|uniref:hypothetical protein n=1 Tax=Bradyrhizobium sp. th-b2 TaxID=172088 RepID=UPI0012EC437E|nr:hypothetical protein [Bradyrhizobium sp. th.b2]
MPKVSILEAGDEGWKVTFAYPDLDSRSFYFSSRTQANTAIDLARYAIISQIQLEARPTRMPDHGSRCGFEATRQRRRAIVST